MKSGWPDSAQKNDWSAAERRTHGVRRLRGGKRILFSILFLWVMDALPPRELKKWLRWLLPYRDGRVRSWNIRSTSRFDPWLFEEVPGLWWYCRTIRGKADFYHLPTAFLLRYWGKCYFGKKQFQSGMPQGLRASGNPRRQGKKLSEPSTAF